MHLIIDQRENPKRIRKVIELLDKNDTYEIKQLGLGDYHICHLDKLLAIVEYKTMSDFVQSYRRGHIQSQIEDLKKDAQPFLIVTGKESTVTNPRSYIRCSTNELIGMKTSLALSGINYMKFETEPQGLKAMISLGHKMERNLSTYEREYKIPERCASSGDLQIDMLITIPGIGMKYAEEIRSKFCMDEFLSLCKDPEIAYGEFRSRGVKVPRGSILAVRDMLVEYESD